MARLSSDDVMSGVQMTSCQGEGAVQVCMTDHDQQ